MKRLPVMVGLLIGLGVAVLAAGALGGQPPESTAQDPLGVVARRGECVQFGSLSYVRGQANGTADPISAVTKLASADIGMGTAVADAVTKLVPRAPITPDGPIVLEQIENGSRVAAYRAMQIDGAWVVTEYEYSGPCAMVP